MGNDVSPAACSNFDITSLLQTQMPALLPFGPSVGDQRLMPSSNFIPLRYGSVFLGVNWQNNFYVAFNGSARVGGVALRVGDSAEADMNKIGNAVNCAPLVENSLYTRYLTQDELANLTSVARTYFPRKSNLRITWAIVATWFRIQSSASGASNTFQLVLAASDRWEDQTSFTLFNFGDLQWGMNHLQSSIVAGMSLATYATTDPPNRLSNVDLPGRFATFIGRQQPYAGSCPGYSAFVTNSTNLFPFGAPYGDWLAVSPSWTFDEFMGFHYDGGWSNDRVLISANGLVIPQNNLSPLVVFNQSNDFEAVVPPTEWCSGLLPNSVYVRRISDPEGLQQLDTVFQRAGVSFHPHKASVATWYQMVATNSSESVRNTFQLIVAYNHASQRSFAVLNYANVTAPLEVTNPFECVSIMRRTPTYLGSTVNDLLQQSNAGVSGRWIFETDRNRFMPIACQSYEKPGLLFSFGPSSGDSTMGIGATNATFTPNVWLTYSYVRSSNVLVIHRGGNITINGKTVSVLSFAADANASPRTSNDCDPTSPNEVYFRQLSGPELAQVSVNVSAVFPWISASLPQEWGSMGRYDAYTYVDLMINGDVNAGPVWGTGNYTADSNVRSAAVHAGILLHGQWGSVRVWWAQGQTAYVGSTRNGVSSQSFGSWPNTFYMTALTAVSPLPVVSS